jgi:hypothetical protein
MEAEVCSVTLFFSVDIASSSKLSFSAETMPDVLILSLLEATVDWLWL